MMINNLLYVTIQKSWTDTLLEWIFKFDKIPEDENNLIIILFKFKVKKNEIQ